jgi:Tfp pilus assembly protein PilF
MLRPLVFALVLALCATGAKADRYEDCVQSADLERKIRGCTQIIERGPRESLENRDSAYSNRGVAYVAKRDKEQAIADFRKALEIDPSNQLAKIGFDVLGVTP